MGYIQSNGLILDFETLKVALEKSKIFLLIFDENGEILKVSDNVPVCLKNLTNVFRILPDFSDIIKRVNKNGFSQDIITLHTPETEKIKLLTFKAKEYYWTLGEVITEQLLIDEVITEKLETLTMYLELAPVFFVVLNEKGKIAYVNNWTLEKTGYSLVEVLGKNWFDIFIPEDIKSTVKRVFDDIMNGRVEPRKTFENDIITKDGKTITVLWQNKLLTKNGKPFGTISVGVDVTEQKIRDFEEDILFSILSATSETSYHDAISKLAKILEEKCNIKRAIGRIQTHEETKFFELLNKIETNERDLYKTINYERRLDEKTLSLEMSYKALPKYATKRCLENIAAVILNFIDSVYYIQKLEEASFRDPLTKLFNRRYFVMMLQAEIRRIKRYGGDSCVVMIDLDGLKQINDTLGHDKGDLAIITLSKVMMENTRNTDVCARFGGDEFAILLPNTPLESAGLIIQRIIDKLDTLDIKEFRISISAGITKILPNDDTNGISVLKRADELLYKAKRSGKHTICIDGTEEQNNSYN
ncbi:diguanylate cyclase [Fervidobacterium pennivorans subsp. shakshaketiis]|uniref:PAS domain S-box/diguanylate cyclase (GGDEF) domain-containing protein n=1 Tax=Fervidobacterium pennivorans (strain DSM 9078 / Ven5) TaxID=771875 RepID=H9UCI9_FERPD|nr:diguanylate cyclase [Fervidobacterium pennivorans]AFG35232.1 PAS domain S-box/diguanylate cyclase (GGDEF) domain-containing protein [Fervidobacterium pennivorans DSM 9078]QIV78404.1 diguanylate cyclase [Fervidobacterium pennivorans subsp. keratinolyticus]